MSRVYFKGNMIGASDVATRRNDGLMTKEDKIKIRTVSEKVNKAAADITELQESLESNVGQLEDMINNVNDTDTQGGANISVVSDIETDCAIYTAALNLINIDLAAIKENNTEGIWNENSYTMNGVTFTINDDGSLSTSGTASAETVFKVDTSENFEVFLNALRGKYLKLSLYGKNTNTSSKHFSINYTYGTNNTVGVIETGNTLLPQKEIKSSLGFVVTVHKNETPSFNETKFMLENVADENSEGCGYYVPFEYEVTGCGKNVFSGENRREGYSLQSDTGAAENEAEGYVITKNYPIPDDKLAISYSGEYIGEDTVLRVAFGKSGQGYKQMITVDLADNPNYVLNKGFAEYYDYLYMSYNTECIDGSRLQIEYDDKVTEFESYKADSVMISLERFYNNPLIFGLKAYKGVTNISNEYGAEMTVVYPRTAMGYIILNSLKPSDERMRDRLGSFIRGINL